MIVVDTSAIFAILTKEPDGDTLLRAMYAAEDVVRSTATYLELSIVCVRRSGQPAVQEMQAFLRSTGVRLIGFDPAQAEIAGNAYRIYGKGRHPAALNFGDCFAYALAKDLDAPLLYKGTDFAATQVASASTG